MFYNASLLLNEHPPEGGGVKSVELGEYVGGRELMASHAKAYDFGSHFYSTKDADNIDSFLAGGWLSLGLLVYDSLDLAKKWRGKVVPAMQKLGLATHHDYGEMFLECILICLSPLQALACVGEGGMGGQVLQGMGFGWDCEEFSDTYDIISRGDRVSFLNLFSKESFVLVVNLLLFLCDLAPEGVRRGGGDWIPSNKKILEMNSACHVFSDGMSILDIPSLVCLVYERMGKYTEAQR